MITVRAVVFIRGAESAEPGDELSLVRMRDDMLPLMAQLCSLGLLK
jgi:hypothetical protein